MKTTEEKYKDIIAICDERIKEFKSLRGGRAENIERYTKLIKEYEDRKYTAELSLLDLENQ